MTAVPAWAGVVVRSLEVSVPWYSEATGARCADQGDGWAVLRFADGSAFELHEGDPSMPGGSFPSYGDEPGPPVMPGFGVEEPELLAGGLPVARAFPGWVVVVAPGGLRVVLADLDSARDAGVVGFRVSTPHPDAFAGFLGRLGASAEVEDGEGWRVVPLVAGDRDERLVDPDGNALELVRVPARDRQAPPAGGR